MENMTETVSRYVSAWNEKTPEAVKAALLESCVAGITYTDKQTPLIDGIDGLVKLIMSSHDLFPGRTFWVQTSPEYFGNHCYYTWGGNLPVKGDVIGHDYMQYNDENKITAIIGFLPV